MKRFLLALGALAMITGCAMKGRTAPGAAIPFAKADYTVLGTTSAEECGTYIIGINFGALFKNEVGALTPDGFAPWSAAANAGFALGGIEGAKAMYMALEKMPDATHLLAPRVSVEQTGITTPFGPGMVIFGKNCATVEARGVKIGDKPTVNQ